MSNKVIDTSTGTPRKMPGWHSWRHRSRDAQDAARDTYLASRGRQARRLRAMKRLAAAPSRDARQERELETLRFLVVGGS